MADDAVHDGEIRYESDDLHLTAALGAEHRVDLVDLPRYFVLNLTGRTVKAAGDLAEKHARRAFYALHLASAIDLRSSGASSIRFLTADSRLRDPARLEGFET